MDFPARMGNKSVPVGSLRSEKRSGMQSVPMGRMQSEDDSVGGNSAPVVPMRTSAGMADAFPASRLSLIRQSMSQGLKRIASGTEKSSAMAEVKDAQPLLKVDESGKAVLAAEGLALIRSIRGPIFPVLLLGNKRSGKSFLAAHLLGVEEAFVSSDSDAAVTVGIDAIVCPMSMLLRPDEMQPSDENMHILVLDCEGNNRRASSLYALINIFSIMIGLCVVFVMENTLTEACISNLGAILATKSLIKRSGDGEFPSSRLVAVVNRATSGYSSDALDTMLLAEQSDPALRESRRFVTGAFSERELLSVAPDSQPSFDEQILCLRSAVLRGRKSLCIGGAHVNSTQLCSLFETVVEEMVSTLVVNYPSVAKRVCLDGFLFPEADRLYRAAWASVPHLEEYDPHLSEKDPRPAAIAAFDNFAQQVADKSLVNDAREDLIERLDTAWNPAVRINERYKNSSGGSPSRTKGAKQAFEIDSGNGGNCNRCSDRCSNECVVQ